ncbi:MAG: hypothetical protein AAFV80_04960 [Bacteroidota bacterium]
MSTSLKSYIQSQVKNPSEAEITEILTHFKEKSFKKGEYFKKPFTVGHYMAFLPKGSVRIMLYKENGDEITAHIRQDQSFLVDPFRLEGTEPSPLGIECLEDQTLLVAHVDRIQELLETNLAMNIIVRKHYKAQVAQMVKRQYLFIAGTARERYQFIQEHHPDMLRKFPLRFIASIIGVSPTQLSRIRRKK